jgi:hypothetical protein
VLFERLELWREYFLDDVTYFNPLERLEIENALDWFRNKVEDQLIREERQKRSNTIKSAITQEVDYELLMKQFREAELKLQHKSIRPPEHPETLSDGSN